MYRTLGIAARLVNMPTKGSRIIVLSGRRNLFKLYTIIHIETMNLGRNGDGARELLCLHHARHSSPEGMSSKKPKAWPKQVSEPKRRTEYLWPLQIHRSTERECVLISSQLSFRASHHPPPKFDVCKRNHKTEHGALLRC
ncbi:uncharacterized protein BDCG_08158 [Blastomyces dermatitidis ER-3]|uniref:Uncharacterized protein n=1 Tax=Ajellomyces dermatitidis (strain ER-3 / ATCC MYA-2586) TaxID=559297 RepID=A0ABP2ES77_AJEDR|nr:uncharacterized protein BDCG_08158 [Blastomyces dermatitidis ER-3]EEQ84889.2 hypothetical protein BDCG_08158 [Blastomyces dermatitidis ER-3]